MVAPALSLELHSVTSWATAMPIPSTLTPLGQAKLLLPAVASHIPTLHFLTGMAHAQPVQFELPSKYCVLQRYRVKASKSTPSISGLISDRMSCTSAIMRTELALVLTRVLLILLILQLELLLLFLLREFPFLLFLWEFRETETNESFSSYAYTTMPGEISSGLGITVSIAIPTHPVSYFPGIAPISTALG